MLFFPTTVVDDFFEHPDDVLDLAKEVEYHRESEFYPGESSKLFIHDIDQGLFSWTMQKIASLYWDFNYTRVKYECKMDFQKVFPYHDKDHLLNKGAIHHDIDISGVTLAGLVYLNKDIGKDAGTSIYDLKKEHQFYSPSSLYLESLKKYHSGEDVKNIEEIVENHANKFEETLRVQNKYNRMILYSPELWHGPTTYGDEIRYILRFFVHHLTSVDQSYPLARKPTFRFL